ncbi:hypothetical protein [Massilia sp. Mn16-1_5]|uniref:hypothetical protein n=1 Tax=Massilia sp. Mn16-1_5 TaxID=2079199 RepID=UPI001446F77F|nr:hypothetical protein [Massilia sp. Mn16-1_5]
MKIQKNNKVAGALLIASGFAFFISAGLARQPAFSAVGGALVVIGISILRKANRG